MTLGALRTVTSCICYSREVKTWALSADVSRPKSVFRRFLFQYLQGRLALQKKRKVSLISALTVASDLGDICSLARSCMYAQCKK